MSIVDQAIAVGQTGGPFAISGDHAQELCRKTGLSIHDLMMQLLPLAARFALAETSGFRVGAIAGDETGSLFFGANLEFTGCDLRHTIHAEQAAVICARWHGAEEIRRLAVSAAPCGMCRQFLAEFHPADKLEVLFDRENRKKLTELLPFAFLPQDLSRNPAATGLHEIRANTKTSADQLSIDAARRSHAPYTDAVSGCCLETADGACFSGSYLENAAFNPSISALQAALTVMSLQNRPFENIKSATIAQRADSAVDHFLEAKSLLQKIQPTAMMRRMEFEALP